VDGALEVGEALDQAPGVAPVAADRALPLVVQRDHQDDEQDDDAADRDDPPVAHLPPRLAGGGEPGAGVLGELLDQDAPLADLHVVDRARRRARVAHPAPEGRVVARLGLGTLGVGLVRLRLGRRAALAPGAAAGGTGSSFVASPWATAAPPRPIRASASATLRKMLRMRSLLCLLRRRRRVVVLRLGRARSCASQAAWSLATQPGAL
jgi:hypothetical protein